MGERRRILTALACLAVLVPFASTREGSATTATREKYPSVSAPGPGQVALTFDDGPVRGITTRVINILERNRVGGTFFIVGTQATRARDVVLRAHQLGHSIQNHTWSHPRLTRLTNAEIRWQLEKDSTVIERITGVKPTTYRPPYGSRDDRVIGVAASLGYRTIMWNASPGTSVQPASRIVASIRSQALALKRRGRGVNILFHDGSGCGRCMVEALPTIIRDLKRMGFEFVVIR